MIEIIGDWISMNISNVDLIKCIKYFESGYTEIFLVDDEDLFTGMVIYRDKYSNVWNCIDNNDWITTLDDKDMVINPVTIEEWQDKGEQIFKCNGGNNIPIIIEGKIVLVVGRRYEKYNECKLKWNKLSSIKLISLSIEYPCIYISTVENPDMREMYKLLSKLTKVYILNDHNIEDMLSDKKNIFVYYSDIYKFADIKTYSVFEMHSILKSYVVSFLNDKLLFKKDFGVCYKKDVSLLNCIKLFDKGYRTICIEDDNNRMTGQIMLDSFKKRFPAEVITFWSNYFVEDDIDRNNKLTELMYEKGGEIPVTKDGKIVAIAKNVEEVNIDFLWDYIDEKVLSEYFGRFNKIVLSSSEGKLKDFYIKYKDILNLTLVNSENMADVIDGEYDLLIYSADIWANIIICKESIYSLYLKLLSSTVYNYLRMNKVPLIYVEPPNADGVKNWMSMISHEFESVVPFEKVKRGIGYYNAKHYQDGHNVFDNGERYTKAIGKDYKHDIYFYGICIAFGAYVRDEDTIESNLQKEIDKYNLPYRVHNCATGGLSTETQRINSINTFHNILTSRFRENDIVIAFGIDKDCVISDMNILLSGAFDKKCKCFIDCFELAHMNAEGNILASKYLFEKLKDYMNNNETISENIEPMYSSNLYSESSEEYISNLPKITGKKNAVIGSIVMNCNPFTLGHKYLVEQALKQADYLYIFIVEEDKSAVSFVDRFEIANRCLRDYSNVYIVPSGKFIISSYTFGEYFDKDALQNISINPSMDIEIFGNQIAPALNITKRFVGEEPFDKVTEQYNITMKRILPVYGIELIELPRYAVEKNVISASKIRKLVNNGILEQTEKYLPSETYKFLCDHPDCIRKKS